MRKKTIFFLLVILCSFPLLVISQSRLITGRVTNQNGEPLPSASVLIKGSNNGVSADETGRFSLNVPDNSAVLVVSSIGFAPREIAVGSATSFNIALTSSTALTEVVVTALG